MVIRMERGADLHMAQLMPLPLTVSCFSKIQIVFACLVLAHLDRPRKRDVKLEVCTRMGTAGILRNPQVSRGCGYECCRNTAGMDLTIVAFPQGWILLRREPRIEPFT